MPRNAAKKTNKNKKRLPVLIKLTSINNKKKKKNNNKNKDNNSKSNNNNNGSSSGNSNSNNTTLKNTTKKKQQQQNNNNNKNDKVKKAVKSTFTNKLNKINENCDVNILKADAATAIATAVATTATPTKKTLQTNLRNSPQKLSQQPEHQQQQNILRYLKKSDNLEDKSNDEKLEKNNQNIVNNNNKEDDKNFICNNNNSISNCKTETTAATTNFQLSTTSSSTTPSVESSSSSSSTLPFPTCHTSSLYPIVIETSETFLQENVLNETSSTLIHSNNIATCYTAVDTLKLQQQQQKKSQNNNNHQHNKVVTTSKRNNNNNNNQQKELATTVATAATTVSSSKPLQHQSQEVKARLATLRTRKVLQSPDKAQKGHKSSSTVAATTTVVPATLDKQLEETISEDKTKAEDKPVSTVVIQFIKRVLPALDEATLNLIETLNDNEVKKPNNKRKRSQSALLLGLTTLHQPRSKRIAATTTSSNFLTTTTSATEQKQIPTSPSKSPITTAAAAVAAVGQKEQKQQQSGGNFLKPLPISKTNTNSKKRPRIMSLYERPYQTTANDAGGRSVVGNGYMTSNRASTTGGGGNGGGVIGGGGVVIMNDTNDTQEMASQYYLSGTSGSGIAGNSSNPSLVGNGSAINHAPTMGTLCNIGNTCYLNSVVYTLRFAPQFLHNLHHLLADLNALQQNIARARAKSSSLGRGISAVHMENARSWSSKDLASMEQYNNTSSVATTTGLIATGGAIGNATVGAGVASSTNSTAVTQVTQKSTHQLLTEKLHELFQSLHRNEINESTEPHHADTLLHAIQDVSSIFEGNQQQDAHEFLMCLLNSIRETSQTLIKAIAECPDVIMNGYISNPDEIERDLIKNTSIGGGGIGSSNNSNSLASSALSSLTSSSKTSSFFSRKSKRKDETKNSKNSRLQSPLKDALMSGGGVGGNTQTTANSLFYLNTNDLNSSTSPPAGNASASAISGGGVTSAAAVTSPSNSAAHLGAGDDVDAPSAVALLLKDKQRLVGKIRELGLDFFNEDFEGITVSTTKCLSCETITEQKETMIDIAVPVPQAGYDSNEFMDRPSSFIQNSCITREYFRNENKYRCEQCCGYTEAIRSISYEVLPRLLIIQLSRFSGGMEKINSYIPTSFTLQCFCSKCCELSDANKLHIYKLYSVITHVGATMSVGHYIAYTCSLDWANEYINCPKEQRRRASQERQLAGVGGGPGNGTAAVTTGNTQSSSSSSLGSSSTGFMKMKMKFGRNKASSSGDMSKNVKHINGLTTSSKAITNGIGKLTMNATSAGGGGTGGVTNVTPQCPVTCQSINCCAMRLTAQQQLQYQSANNSTSDFSEESSQYSNGSGYNTPANYNNNLHNPYTTSTTTLGYGSTGRGSTKASYATTQNNCSEPIWYMCDDDKIKAMTQREFEELLSPARKITITPYLLFYARYNLQSTPPKSTTASSSSPGPVTSSPQTSWSNESLQSSGHSAHSSGMRM